MTTTLNMLYIFLVQFFSPFSPIWDWIEGVVPLLYVKYRLLDRNDLDYRFRGVTFSTLVYTWGFEPHY